MAQRNINLISRHRSIFAGLDSAILVQFILVLQMISISKSGNVQAGRPQFSFAGAGVIARTIRSTDRSLFEWTSIGSQRVG